MLYKEPELGRSVRTWVVAERVVLCWGLHQVYTGVLNLSAPFSPHRLGSFYNEKVKNLVTFISANSMSFIVIQTDDKNKSATSK